MRHRIFIAINLPENIKKKLEESQSKIEELFTPYQAEGFGAGPVRWTKKENLHITLIFLGYLSDEELLDVCKIVKEVSLKHNSFIINLVKVCYGPTDKKPPRMIWVVGEKSDDFAFLKDDLDKTLGISENREFFPHITLGRIKQWEFKRIEPEEIPVVDIDISLNFEVNSIEIMESRLKRGGAEYAVHESAPLD